MAVSDVRSRNLYDRNGGVCGPAAFLAERRLTGQAAIKRGSRPREWPKGVDRCFEVLSLRVKQAPNLNAAALCEPSGQ